MSSAAPTLAPSRGIILGICIIAGSTYIVLASYNYMLPAMLADLDLTSEQGSLALKIPSLASLLVVFVAGRIGDQLGHRKVILVGGVFFIVGCLVVAFAQGLAMVSIGMFLEGVAATGIQIVALGLLTAQFVDPKARAAAFAIYGMAYPAVYFVFPVLAGWLTTYVTWRAIPLMWVVGGVVLLITARALLPSASPQPIGELWTPILAGLFAVGIVQFLSHASDYGATSWPALVFAGLTCVSLVACIVLLRRLPSPSLSIAPLKNGATTIILAVVILVPTLNTFFFVTIALQYQYGNSAFVTALLMMPAQLASMLGAKYLSEKFTDRVGIKRAGVILLLMLACVMAIPLTFSGTTPVWWVLFYACAFGAVVTGVVVVVLNALMSSAPADEGGNTAAYQGSAEEVGYALGVVLMGALVFGVGQASLEARLEESGLPPDQAAAVIADLQESTSSPELTAAYSYPLPDGTDATDAQKEAIADGLSVNGAAGIVISLVAAGLFALHRRQAGDDPAAYEEEPASA